MNYVHIVAVLAVLQFFLFGILVGRARAKHGIKAPATSGSELFERAFRVHMNTLDPARRFRRGIWSAMRSACFQIFFIGTSFKQYIETGRACPIPKCRIPARRTDLILPGPQLVEAAHTSHRNRDE